MEIVRCTGEGKPYTKKGECPDCDVSWKGLMMPKPASDALVPWHAAREKKVKS